MGYCTEQIDINIALKMTVNGGEVVSASRESYFLADDWNNEIAHCELKDDEITLFFTLSNGDFVEYKCNLSLKSIL